MIRKETTSTFQKALELDISVLRSLITRSRNSHGCTKYHRRLCLSLRNLERYSVTKLNEVTKLINEERCKRISEHKRKKYRDEDCDFKILSSPTTLSSNYSVVDKREIHPFPKEGSALTMYLQWMNYTILHSLPEVLSRIENACDLLLFEISHGFFLSLCCVAFSACSRIRVILLRMGREAIQECIEVMQSIDKIFSSVSVKEKVKKLCTFPNVGRFMETQIETTSEDNSSSPLTTDADIGERINVNSSLDKDCGNIDNSLTSNKSNTFSPILFPSKVQKPSSYKELQMTKKKKKRKKQKSGDKKQKKTVKRDVLDDIFDSVC